MREGYASFEWGNDVYASPKDLQKLGDLLNICKDVYSGISELILMNKKNELTSKLTDLGNEYQELSYIWEELDSKNQKILKNGGSFEKNNLVLRKEDCDKWQKKIKSFFVKLGGILNDVVENIKKWEDEVADGFVEYMFKLNDSFCKLSENIKDQETATFLVNYGLDGDLENNPNFAMSDIYDTIFEWYRSYRKDNKSLWIMIYRPLLRLVNKELETLLGSAIDSSDVSQTSNVEDYNKGMRENDINIVNKEFFGEMKEVLESLHMKKKWILSKWDIERIEKEFKNLLVKKNTKKFESISKNLFIMDYYNIKSYEDFCNKYDILKKRQEDLLAFEREIDEYFDEEWNLKSDAKIDALHIEKLRHPDNILKKIAQTVKIIEEWLADLFSIKRN